MKTTFSYFSGGFACLLSVAISSMVVNIAHGDEPIPQIRAFSIVSNHLDMVVSNVVEGATYYIEQTDALPSTNWLEAVSFEGFAGTTNWGESIESSITSAFYRVVRDPYHAKVGQSATLITRYHSVSGSAHIVNNRTIELRNFNFDGQGLDVVVFVSPNSNYDPGISISENLLRATPYINTNMSFSLPEGYNLDDANYISIWCIDIPISFGDGVFQ